MGVTKPFISAHFGSKADLLAELGRRFVIAVRENRKPIAVFTREEKNLAPGDFTRIGGLRRDAASRAPLRWRRRRLVIRPGPFTRRTAAG